MRITSFLMAAGVLVALFLWFGGASKLGLVDPPSEIVASEAPADAAAPVEDAANAPAPAVAVIVLPSESQNHVSQLIMRGRTEAQRRVEVAAETGGQVISEPLRRGAVVAEGDVLCRIDPGMREAERAEAQARLDEATALFTAADRLSDRGYGSETDAITKRAMLEAAEAGLRRVDLDMERLVIRAPFAGILETDTAELGALMAPGTACATVIDLDPIKVTGFVSETEVGKLTTGQPAAVGLVDGSVHEGAITYISRSADPETRTYQVDVTLPNPEGRIRDGMTAEIRVALEPVRAHLLPQTALTLDDDGRLGIRAAADGVVAFHPVIIIEDRRDGIWLAGLPERLDVIVRGQEFVRAGSAVTATEATPAMLDDLDPELGQ